MQFGLCPSSHGRVTACAVRAVVAHLSIPNGARAVQGQETRRVVAAGSGIGARHAPRHTGSLTDGRHR